MTVNKGGIKTHSKVKDGISTTILKQLVKKFPNDEELGAHIRYKVSNGTL